MANDSEMLNKSKNSTRDDKNEYYTLYEDIAAELSNYKEILRGKRIICPCDWDESLEEVCVFASEEVVRAGTLFEVGGSIKTIDTGKTKHFERDLNIVKCNFIKYLISHAEDWGISSVSVSGYNPSTGEGVKFQDVDYSKYDLCITNPPFSLFRDFIDTMFKHKISFIVIGPQIKMCLLIFRKMRCGLDIIITWPVLLDQMELELVNKITLLVLVVGSQISLLIIEIVL